MAEPPKDRKICFVTIGATAAFDALIKATLEPAFLQTLERIGYTDLRFQYGHYGAELMNTHISRLKIDEEESKPQIEISGFDFKTKGLRKEMVAARTGVVISHAGSGSILDALRVEAPLIVIPNDTLLHNHQEELAEEMARQGYAVHGSLDGLSKALWDAEKLRRKTPVWPPKSSEGDGRGLPGVINDELGFVD